MAKVYHDGQAKTRLRRPNPRVPLDAEIAAAAADTTAAIVAGMSTPCLEMLPVTRLAEEVVHRRFGRLGTGSLLAEVVEAVLACPVARLALHQQGLHVAGR